MLSVCTKIVYFFPLLLSLLTFSAEAETLLFHDNFDYDKNHRSPHWYWRHDSLAHHVYGQSGARGSEIGFVIPVPADSSYQACGNDNSCQALETCRQGFCIPYQNSEIYNSPCYPTAVLTTPMPEWERSLILSQCAASWNLSDNLVKLSPNPVAMDTQADQYITDLYLNQPLSPGMHLAWDAQASSMVNGSRGWGLWNTNVVPGQNSFAWFMQMEGLDASGYPYLLSGNWLMIVLPGTQGNKILLKPLPALDENWHHYEIFWAANLMVFTIDYAVVHVELTTIPQGQMAFHNWVDNALFALDSTGQLTHITQKLQVPRTNTLANYQLFAWSSSEQQTLHRKLYHEGQIPATATPCTTFPVLAKKIAISTALQKAFRRTLEEQSGIINFFAYNQLLSLERGRLLALAHLELRKAMTFADLDAILQKLSRENQRIQTLYGGCLDGAGSLQGLLDSYQRNSFLVF